MKQKLGTQGQKKKDKMLFLAGGWTELNITQTETSISLKLFVQQKNLNKTTN